MAELQFFATESDHESVIRMLVSKYEAAFVLDGLPPPAQPASTVEGVMEVLRQAKYEPRFYVVSRHWQVEPLAFGETKASNGQLRHYVRSRDGGPSFDYLVSRPRLGDRGPQIVSSWFSDFTHYYSQLSLGTHIARPTAMSDAYKDVRKVISRGGERTTIQEIHKPGPIAMEGARQAFKSGTWLRAGEWHHAPKSGS